MGKKYYHFEEIKEKFISYRNPKESNITDDEYNIFCGELQYLPKTIIDTIYDEIYFVLMSVQPGKGTPACYVNLRKGFDVKKKKGIVVLSPYIFGASLTDKNGNKRIYLGCEDGYKILHEIAHHVLNHSCEDEEQINFEEKEANEQVKEWVDQFWEFQVNG